MKLENSPKHHPAANGMVQKRSTARDWVDQSTEGRIGYEHHADNRTEHPVMTFMVSSCSNHHQQDSLWTRTARHRWRRHAGRPQTDKKLELGEKVSIQPMTKYNKMNKLDVRWQHGLIHGSGNESENGRDHGDRSRWK